MKYLFFFISILSLNTVIAQDTKELFKGENLLSECRQDIPLTYRRKDDNAVAAKAKELEGKELIFLSGDSKSSTATYFRCYLISEVSGREIFNFLIDKVDYQSSKKRAIFLKYTKKINRFYLAECFDEVLKNNSELAKSLKEESRASSK